MRIVLLNTHSVLNSGDAAIVAAEIGLLREILGNVQITATSRTPRKDGSFFRELDAEVLAPLFPAPSIWRSTGEKLAGCAGNLSSLGAKQRLIRAIAGADLVVSSGGGYFFSNRHLLPGPMFWQAYCHVRLAERFRKPVLFAPQSFGPLANRAAGALVRRLVAHSSVVAVLTREQVSHDLLRRLGRDEVRMPQLAICPDLAFAFDRTAAELVRTRVADRARPVLGVTVREWGFPESRSATERRAKRASYFQAVVDTCVSFHTEHRGSILVFPQARGPGRFEDDRAISREVVERLASVVPAARVALEELPEDAPPERVLGLVASVDVLLATRFHSAIFACLAGKPFLAVGYQPKTSGIMRMLGLEEFTVPIGEACAERLSNLLETLVRDGQSIVETRIRPATTRLAAEVRSTMRNALLPCLTEG